MQRKGFPEAKMASHHDVKILTPSAAFTAEWVERRDIFFFFFAIGDDDITV